MNIVHLTASTFYGGPERQILGLARALAPDRPYDRPDVRGGRSLPGVPGRGAAAVRRSGGN